MINKLSWVPFSAINLADPFFDSLKSDYPEFNEWFDKKAKQGCQALTLMENGNIYAFLAMKKEKEEISLENIRLPAIERIKISTLKLDDSIGNQRLGEGLIGVALWYWQKSRAEEIYVTVYEKQEKLIGLLKHFGFVCAGKKPDGELLLLKNRKNIDYSDAYKAFPFLSPQVNKGGIIPIQDNFHDRLFPYSDSFYKNKEVEETTAGNGITKIYVGNPYSATHYSEGEIVGIYRIFNGPSKSNRSAITSFCTITKIIHVKRNGTSLMSQLEYLEKAGNKTVFSREELCNIYKGRNVIMIEMVYNGFFDRGHNVPYYLLKNNGLFEKHPYEIDYSIEQMKKILELGGKDVNNIIIN